MLKILLKPAALAVVFALFKTRNSTFRKLLFAALNRHHPNHHVCVDGVGASFVIDTADRAIGRELFCRGSFDADKFAAAVELLRWEQLLAGRRTLLDLGANIGTVCIPAVRSGVFERAVAVEPDPDNLRLLRANIALNGLDERIVVVPRALSEVSGTTLELEKSPVNFGDHRVSLTDRPGPRRERDRTRIHVTSVKLDDIMTEQALTAAEVFIWMDIQGYEGRALAGATRTLGSRPPLVIEFWPYGMQRAASFEALLRTLDGYGCYVDLRDPAASRRDTAQLRALYASLGEDGDYTDLLVFAPAGAATAPQSMGEP